MPANNTNECDYEYNSEETLTLNVPSEYCDACLNGSTDSCSNGCLNNIKDVEEDKEAGGDAVKIITRYFSLNKIWFRNAYWDLIKCSAKLLLNFPLKTFAKTMNPSFIITIFRIV